MDNNEMIQRLKSLRSKIEYFNSVSEVMDADTERLQKALNKRPSAVFNFDSNHLQQYIKRHIGPEPEEPKGVVKLLVPVYRAKKKQYELDAAAYSAAYEKYKKLFYVEYEDKRKGLEEEERERMARDREVAESAYHATKIKYNAAKEALDADAFLPEKLKKTDTLDELISYFQEQRVDTLKDAVNLYYEEQHRRKLEQYAEEQMKFAKEAAEQARKAAKSAEEAAENARMAIDQVEEAMRRADSAYSKAEEAYEKADEAYFRAQIS